MTRAEQDHPVLAGTGKPDSRELRRDCEPGCPFHRRDTQTVSDK